MRWWNFLLLILQLSSIIFARRGRHGRRPNLPRKSHRLHHRIQNTENDFWNDEHLRIVNGTKAKGNHFPWAAAILSTPCNKVTGQLNYSKGDDYREKTCGASILSSKYLITAAHCFFVPALIDNDRCKNYCDCDPVYEYEPKDLKVVTGILSLDFEKNMGSWHSIEKFHIHPQFNKKSFANDIGLIVLFDENLIQYAYYSVLIQPIPIWPNVIGEGTKAAICGWGDNCWQEEKDSDKIRENESEYYHLKYIKVITSEPDACSWDKMMYNKTYENAICAVAENQNLGLGDSGNGLVTERGDKKYLIGIASTFLKCGHTKSGNVSSVYTRLSTFMEWLDEILNNNNGPVINGDSTPDDSNGDYYPDGSFVDYIPDDSYLIDHGDNYWDYTINHPYYHGNHYHNHWSYINKPQREPYDNGDNNNNRPCGNRLNNKTNTNRPCNYKPYNNKPYYNSQSKKLWQWIHKYPKLPEDKLPKKYAEKVEEPNYDDDDTIKHKSSFNYNRNVNSNLNNNNNINSNTNYNHGYNRYGLFHNMFLRKHNKFSKTPNYNDDDDDNTIKHKNNFNYNSNINNNINSNANRNHNYNSNYGYNQNGVPHYMFMRKHNGFAKAMNDNSNKDDDSDDNNNDDNDNTKDDDNDDVK